MRQLQAGNTSLVQNFCTFSSADATTSNIYKSEKTLDAVCFQTFSERNRLLFDSACKNITLFPDWANPQFLKHRTRPSIDELVQQLQRTPAHAFVFVFDKYRKYSLLRLENGRLFIPRQALPGDGN